MATTWFRLAATAGSIGFGLSYALTSWGQTSPATLPDLHLSKAGTVNAMVVQDDGQIVIGGSFTSVNDVPLRNLARINNVGAVDAAWMPNPDGPVLALATSGTNLFVGGQFQNIGGQFRNGLALLRTSGLGAADSIWVPLPDNPAIYSLMISGTNLFVGGSFQSVGFQTRSNLAKLSIPGTGAADMAWNPSANAAVYAFALNGTNLYVGGLFTSIGVTNRNRLAKLSIEAGGQLDGLWDPNVDSFIPYPFASSSVSTLLLSGTNLFVSGLFSDVGGNNRVDLAKVSASGNGAVDPNWNPQPAYSITDTGNFALAAVGTNLFVGGQFTQIGGLKLTNLARLSTTGSGVAATNWSPKVNGPVNTLLINYTWLLVGGSFSVANSTVSSGMTKVDQGTGILDTAFGAQVSTPGAVYAMVRQPDGKIIVGGDFWLAGQVLRPHLARIKTDGSLDTAWATAADGIVNALALNGTNLFVGGVFHNIGAQSRNCIAKVDTSGTDLVDANWNPGISPLATVYALVADNTNLYVGGSNLGIGGQAALSFAKASVLGAGATDSNWNGVADGPVYAIGISQTNVFAGGYFTAIHGRTRYGLAKFLTTANGVVDTNWNANVDPGGNPAIYTLAASGANLFFGGSFSTVGGQSRIGLAKASTLSTGAVDLAWSPTTNSLLGPVLDAYALAISGTNLYVQGYFEGNEVNLARVSTGGIGVVDTNWHPNPYVSAFQTTFQGAILPIGQEIYVGGVFDYLGGSYIGAPDAAPRNGFAFLAVADAPVMVKNNAANFVILSNPANGVEVTHFQITSITGGSLFLADGVTQINIGDFISMAQGAAGLVFVGSSGTISAVSALNDTTNGVGTAASTLNLGAAQSPVFSFSSPNYAVNENGGYVIVSVRKQGVGAASVSYATTDGTAIATGFSSALVVPNANATLAGNAANAYPFDLAQVGLSNQRYQQVYANSQFGAIPPNGAFITTIAFRAYSDFTNATLPAIQINLSTTTKPPDGLSSTFTNNSGSDDTVVFNGPLTLSSAATGSPPVFDIAIPLTTPFLYNPAVGDLLLDVRNAGGGLTATFDAVTSTNDSVSRLYGSVTNNFGNSDSIGLVTRFKFSPLNISGADYTNTSGTLNFGVADTNMDITIGIINDTVFEGDESFSISLSNPTAGASISYPGTATITIFENDPIAPTTSYITNSLPSALPSATGVLIVNFQPPLANGRWRLVGESTWQTSGNSINSLVTGNYRVEFLPVNGYRQPDAMIASIVSGITLRLTNSYVASTNASDGTGYISLLVCPDDVATNLTIALRGQWRVPLVETNWLNSGEAVTNLSQGSYAVEFKDVTNLVTPSHDPLVVYADEGVRITGTYRLTTEGIGSLPGLVSFGAAVSNRPYLYAGQIQTDAGFGSGVVVKDRVVLTAAQLLFDPATLSYVNGVRWFFQRYAGTYEPVPQIPRGWHVFAGYAAQRGLDDDACVQSLQSQDLNVAAIYFFESAGRGGFGGYLVSGDTNWLTSSRQKMLAGYPMEVVSITNQGKLMATLPSNLMFTQVYSNIYSTTNVSAYPGLAGGPLFVQGDDTNYYTAGVYLGPSQSSALVRELDAAAADLINRADLSGTLRLSVPLPKSLTPGPLVSTPGPTTADTNVQSIALASQFSAILEVDTGPPAALNAGGGWRIGDTGSWQTGLSNHVTIPGQSTAVVKFACIPDNSFGLPYKRPNRTINLSPGALYMVYYPYLPSPPSYSVKIGTQPGVTLSGGKSNYTYQIEYTTSLGGKPVWTPFTTAPITITSPGDIFILDPRNQNGVRFYRATWLTCPP